MSQLSMFAALMLGVALGVSGSLGALCLWWKQRPRIPGLLGIGVFLLLSSLAGLGFLLWLSPTERWTLVLSGVLLGVSLFVLMVVRWLARG
jgi:hypothetical protein